MEAGFFGKLRSHGDFVSRRLPLAMQQPFDAWLQAGIVQSRVDLGDAWLPTYLNSPLWRFVLAPGVCGPQAWAGVMMPSVDRVGRCFPLILASGMDAAPALPDCLVRHAPWFVQLEELALTTLDDDFVLERFAATLRDFNAALGDGPRPASASTGPAGECVVTALDGVAPPGLAEAGLDAGSAWWTDGSRQVAPCLAVCAGLPPAPGFAAVLDGAWTARGWRRV